MDEHAPGNSANHFPLPPVSETKQGAARRIGVELEMGGLDIDTLSAVVADFIGGRIEKVSRYEHVVHGDPAGDWSVELDFAYLKAKGLKTDDPDDPLAELNNVFEDLISRGAERIVPLEVVSPPLPMKRLADTDALIERLREAGALGTAQGIAYAFGMQLNPEAPDTDSTTLRRYLQAFLCLFDWLKARADIDFTRRLTAYIDPFPSEYVRKVVDPGYSPSLDALIDDYLDANPTRNRALDMLPMFMHVDEERVRAKVDDDRVKSRPAFHYRLPNCEIDRADWGIGGAWGDWLQVEKLAAEQQKLEELCARYSEFLNDPLTRLFDDWGKEVEDWMRQEDR